MERDYLNYLINNSSVLYELNSSLAGKCINLANEFNNAKRLAAVVGFEFSSAKISSIFSCFFDADESALFWPKMKIIQY